MKTRSKPCVAGPGDEVVELVLVDAAQRHGVDLDREPGSLRRREPFEDRLEPAAAGDLGELRRVERVDRDVDPAHAAIAQFAGVAGELAAIGRQGQLVERAGADMPAERAEQGHDVAADQRLAAGQAKLFDAEPDEGAAHPVELLEGQKLGFRQKSHLFRHAIDAAEVAAVGDRYAQIGDGSSKRVDHAWLARTAAHLVKIGARPANVAPDLVMVIPALPRRLLGEPVPEHLLLGVETPVAVTVASSSVELAVFFKVADRELDSPLRFVLDETRNLRLRLGLSLQNAL